MVLTSFGSVTPLLEAVAATGVGAAYKAKELYKTFTITITGTATVKIQGYDGAEWFDIAETTVSGAVQHYFPWQAVRANVTAYTSGTVTVRLIT